MPFFNIYSNVELLDNQKDKFLSESLSFVASELRKPAERVIVNYIYNPNMLFGTNPEDFGALVEVKSIGFPDDMARVATNFTHFLHKSLGVVVEHIEIEYIDLPPSTISIAGKLRG